MLRKSEKFRRVLNSVCDITEFSKREILSQSKVVDVCMARNILFLLCHRDGLKPVTIKRLCQKEGWTSVGHSTILKNITRAKQQEEINEEFKRYLNEVEKSIQTSN